MRFSIFTKTSALFAAVTLVAGNAYAQSTNLIINEIYPGGGSSLATSAYQRDFIELYNVSSSAINLTGYTLQYAAAAGSFNAGNNVFALSGTIAANGYFLINTGTAAMPTAGGAVNPVGDLTTNGLAMGATAGKLALVQGLTNLGAVTGDISSGDTLGGQFIVDFIGYGTTANAREGELGTTSNAPVPTTGNATSLSRTSFIDTDDNFDDFSVLTTPTPQAASAVIIPEASTVSLLALGFAGVVGLVVRRRTAK